MLSSVTLPFLLCTACDPECHTSGARKCFGPAAGNENCCNFYDEGDKCLPACNKVGANFACTGIFNLKCYDGAIKSYMFAEDGRFSCVKSVCLYT